jgi:hypothetical protein
MVAIGWDGAEVVAVFRLFLLPPMVSASNVVGGENRAEALFAENVTCDVGCVMSQAVSSLE